MNRQLRARVLLEEARALGLDVADLVAAATGEPKPITVAAWIDEIAPTFSPSTAATYRPYWRLTTRLLGDRYLAELTITDLAAVVDAAAERARAHRPDPTGRASRETCIAALRALYARAVDAGHLTANPAAGLRKPLRTTSRRRALDDRELAALADAIRATSSDPLLLLLRFHLETGARRQGALNLRLRDVNPARATVWLREQNDTVRERPASPSLVERLVAHAGGRGGGDPLAAVFRNRRANRSPGAATTASSPEPETVSAGTTAPHCRPTCSATPPSPASDASPATRRPSIRRPRPTDGHRAVPAASIADVATAVVALTGEPRPLAHPEHESRRHSCSDRGR